jgi:hypothetical protein
MEVGKTDTHFKNLEEASEYILQIIANFIRVNTLCVTRVNQKTSLMIGTFNREKALVDVGMNLSLFHAY